MTGVQDPNVFPEGFQVFEVKVPNLKDAVPGRETVLDKSLDTYLDTLSEDPQMQQTRTYVLRSIFGMVQPLIERAKQRG